MLAITMKLELGCSRELLIHLRQRVASSHPGWSTSSRLMILSWSVQKSIRKDWMKASTKMQRFQNKNSKADCIVLHRRNTSEKASSFLLSKGFEEVYHLKGGILKYIEEVLKAESLREGECFVFDKRVSVEHGLVQGNFKLCYGCKQAVSNADMEAPEWESGVSCPYCYSLKSEEENERARARQRQFETWGIIGGPDKGRRLAVKPDSTNKNRTQLSASV